jgi:hypothetical protein
MSEENEVEDEQSFEDAFNEFSDGEVEEVEEEVKEAVQIEEEVLDDLEQDEVETEEVDWQAKAQAAEQDANQWKHKFSSDAGRVSALQRKIDAMEQSASHQPQQVDAATNEDTPHDLAEFEEDYPEINKVLKAQEKRFERELERRTAELRSEITPVQDMVRQNETAAEYAALESSHPDWKVIGQDEKYGQWLATQPSQVQEMAGSAYAADVSYVLSNFKQTQPQQQNVVGLAEKRKKQLQDAAIVPSRGNSRSTVVAEDDFDAAFDHYASKKAK